MVGTEDRTSQITCTDPTSEDARLYLCQFLKHATLDVPEPAAHAAPNRSSSSLAASRRCEVRNASRDALLTRTVRPTLDDSTAPARASASVFRLPANDSAAGIHSALSLAGVSAVAARRARGELGMPTSDELVRLCFEPQCKLVHYFVPIFRVACCSLSLDVVICACSPYLSTVRVRAISTPRSGAFNNSAP